MNEATTLSRQVLLGVAAVGITGTLVIAGLNAVSANDTTALTEEQKTQLQTAIESGDRETVLKLREEYGLKGRGYKQGGCMHKKAHREEVKAAVEAGDYDAFVAALPESSPKLEVITEDNFDRYQEMHEAKQAGDYETAQEIHEELGLPEKGSKKRGIGMGRGMFRAQ
jgi:hypothetical protein